MVAARSPGTGNARIAASSRPSSSWANSVAVRSSRKSSWSLGKRARTAGSAVGNRYGAIVGMTPSRSRPVNGSAAPRAVSTTVAAAGAMAARARATTAAPTEVTSTLRRSRSTAHAERVLERGDTALRPGWVTAQAVAARRKLFSSATATAYSSWRSDT